MAKPIQALIALLIIPCWVIAVLYEVDIRTAYSVITRIPTELMSIYGPPRGPEEGRYFYGPFSLVLFSPLSALSFFHFKLLWIGFQTLSYCVFWWLLVRLYPSLFTDGWRAIWVWIISINPIHNNFQSNNIQLMLGAAFLAAEFLSRRPSNIAPFLAGLILTSTAHVKVFPAFLCVYYFLTGRRAMRWGLLVGGVGFGLLPFTIFGPPAAWTLYRDFLVNISTYSADNSLSQVADILCLPSLLARTLGPGLLPSQLSWIISIVTLAVSGSFFAWAWKQRHRQNLWEMAWLLMVFLNPSSRVHYFVFLIPVFCAWAQSLSIHRPWGLAAFGASVALIAFTVEGVVGKAINNRLEYLNLPTWGIAIAVVWCVWAHLPASAWRLSQRSQ